MNFIGENSFEINGTYSQVGCMGLPFTSFPTELPISSSNAIVAISPKSLLKTQNAIATYGCKPSTTFLNIDKDFQSTHTGFIVHIFDRDNVLLTSILLQGKLVVSFFQPQKVISLIVLVFA